MGICYMKKKEPGLKINTGKHSQKKKSIHTNTSV